MPSVSHLSFSASSNGAIQPTNPEVSSTLETPKSAPCVAHLPSSLPHPLAFGKRAQKKRIGLYRHIKIAWPGFPVGLFFPAFCDVLPFTLYIVTSKSHSKRTKTGPSVRMAKTASTNTSTMMAHPTSLKMASTPLCV